MRAGCAVVLLLVAACGGPDGGREPATERRPVEITEVVRPADSGTILLGVQSCNGAPEITSLAQSDARVVVEVTATVTQPGDDCLDSVELVLDEPLGDRELVDLTSGRTLPVSRPR